jgi:hypothetical protein
MDTESTAGGSGLTRHRPRRREPFRRLRFADVHPRLMVGTVRRLNAALERQGNATDVPEPVEIAS